MVALPHHTMNKMFVFDLPNEFRCNRRKHSERSGDIARRHIALFTQCTEQHRLVDAQGKLCLKSVFKYGYGTVNITYFANRILIQCL